MEIRLVPCLRYARAFSLVELTTSLAVTLILLTIAVPGFRSISGSSAVSAGIDDMMSHLHLARHEAIMRGVQVVICPSNDGHKCLDSFQWQGGFMVFADIDENRRRSSNEPVLRVHRHDSGRVMILTSKGRKHLVFKATGMSPGSTATITVCDRTGAVSPKAVILSNPGRARRSTTRADGSPLRCG